jgi:hypothetical protein
MHAPVYAKFTPGLSAGGESHFKITLVRMMSVLITVSSAIYDVMNLFLSSSFRLLDSSQLPWSP